MYLRQLLNDRSACASYVLGCTTHSAFAVVERVMVELNAGARRQVRRRGGARHQRG